MTQRNLFLQYVAQTSPAPLMLEIERAEGSYMFGKKGEQYLDLISGIAVSNLGHCHPKVVHAIQHQAENFMHLMVYGEYVYQPQVQLAKELAALLPKELDNFYFVNSGAEAVEGALKLAKRYTGRAETCSFQNAYHGSTSGALSVMGSDAFKQAFRPLIPGNKILKYNDLDSLNSIDEQTACVLIELVQGEAGVVVGDMDFIRAVRQKCTETGALMIVDEIQTGMGRTGKMFALEHYGIVPDILLLGKALGGGLPLAAFIAPKEIMSTLSHNPVLGHITTFGGNAVCCAAAVAVIQATKEEINFKEVEDKGRYFQGRLEQLQWGEVRRKGLMMSIESETTALNMQRIERCIQKGVVVDWFLFNDKSMRICPPLNITTEEINDAMRVLGEI